MLNVVTVHCKHGRVKCIKYLMENNKMKMIRSEKVRTTGFFFENARFYSTMHSVFLYGGPLTQVFQFS